METFSCLSTGPLLYKVLQGLCSEAVVAYKKTMHILKLVFLHSRCTSSIRSGMHISCLMKQLQNFVLPSSKFRLQEKGGLHLIFVFSSWVSADGIGRRLHSAPGLGLSKTPTAEMEHNLHEANTVPASQVAVSGAKVLGMGCCVGEGNGERYECQGWW